MPNLWIIGAGGYARGIADAALSAGVGISGVVVKPNDRPDWFDGAVIDEERFLDRPGSDAVAIAVGDNFKRQEVESALLARRPNLAFPPVRHSTAYVAASAHLEPGATLLAQAFVGPQAVVGRHACIYSGSVLEHDTVTGAFSSFGPRAATGGTVRIGDRTFLGLGASVCHGCNIGSDTVIGAGAVVVRDIGPGVVAYGNPARIVRTRTRGEPYL